MGYLYSFIRQREKILEKIMVKMGVHTITNEGISSFRIFKDNKK